VPADACSAFDRDGHVLLRELASSGEATAYRDVVREAASELNPRLRS